MARAHTWAVGADGDPLVPPSALAELAAINERLGLRFHRGLNQFIVTLRWADDDPRRAMIQSGGIAPEDDWSWLGSVPVGLSVDDTVRWVQHHIRFIGGKHPEVGRMIADAEARVAALEAAAEAKRTEERLEVLEGSGKNISVGSRRTKHKVA